MDFDSVKFELMRHITRNTQIEFKCETREDLTIERKNNIVEFGVLISDTVKFHDQNKKAATMDYEKQDRYVECLTRVVNMRCSSFIT